MDGLLPLRNHEVLIESHATRPQHLYDTLGEGIGRVPEEHLEQEGPERVLHHLMRHALLSARRSTMMGSVYKALGNVMHAELNSPASRRRRGGSKGGNCRRPEFTQW